MYQASQPDTSENVELWITSFDYVGYVLFFNAIFTVIHAFSIICWSILTSKEYNRFHLISIADVSFGIEILKENRFYRFLYNLKYYPFLTTRQVAEFKVIHVLFRNTFGVPTDFNFGEYLGKCFERYSLNIIKLSVTSWIVMFILYGLNMIRVFTPSSHSFRCEAADTTHSPTPHHDDETVGHTLSSEDESDHSSLTSTCDLSYIRLFAACSVFLELYVFCLFMIGRVYTIRLLKKADVNEINSREDDLAYFLDAEAAREQEDLLGQHQKPSTEIPDSVSRQRSKRMTITTFSTLIGKAKSTKGSKHFGNKVADITEATPKLPPRFGVVSNFQSVKGESLLSEEKNIFSVRKSLHILYSLDVDHSENPSN